MNKSVYAWHDDLSWLADAHLISWTSQITTLAEAPALQQGRALLKEIQAIPEKSNADEAITVRYGLQQMCQSLTLLNPQSDTEIFAADNLSRLSRQLKNAVQPGKNHLIAVDLAAVDLAKKENQQAVVALLITLYNQSYHVDQLGYRSNPAVTEFDLRLITSEADTAYALNNKARAISAGMTLARKLSDTPSGDCTPGDVARQLHSYSQRHHNIHCKVLDMKALEALSMGALCAVGKGSVNLPCLVELSYRGAATEQQAWVLVGKGVTFDSGGLWLKNGAGMSTMKYDMCGAAAVFGAIETIRQLALPINVTAVLALAENMPTDRAMRPGDVVTTHAGLTVEIINTDAEGRLVLADAISYAHEQLNPAGIINVATLTGAVVKALGYDITGVMSNSTSLLSALQCAAAQSYDRIWPLPLDDSFAGQVKSEIADLCNTPPNDAAITVSAGYFLSKFSPERPWAHLDVGGTALTREPFLQATGRPIALLVQFLSNVSLEGVEVGAA